MTTAADVLTPDFRGRLNLGRYGVRPGDTYTATRALDGTITLTPVTVTVTPNPAP